MTPADVVAIHIDRLSECHARQYRELRRDYTQAMRENRAMRLALEGIAASGNSQWMQWRAASILAFMEAQAQ